MTSANLTTINPGSLSIPADTDGIIVPIVDHSGDITRQWVGGIIEAAYKAGIPAVLDVELNVSVYDGVTLSPSCWPPFEKDLTLQAIKDIVLAPDGKTVQLTCQGIVIDCRDAHDPSGSWLADAAQHVGDWIKAATGLPVWYLVDKATTIDKYPNGGLQPGVWLSGLDEIVVGGDWNNGSPYVPWAKSWWAYAGDSSGMSWVAKGDRSWLWSFLGYTPAVSAETPVSTPVETPPANETSPTADPTTEDTGIVWAAWENSILGGMTQMIDLLTKIEANTRK